MTIPDSELVERAVRNAHLGHAKARRWAHVMGAFGCGSTVAHGLCARFGLDPDEEIGLDREDDE